ncbi:hypothetical protein ABPG73_008489 [Tetrahymena malaccensis]
MEQISSNSQQQEAIKQNLLQHLKTRQKIKQIQKEKNIQMLDKQEQLSMSKFIRKKFTYFNHQREEIKSQGTQFLQNIVI